MTNCDSFSLRTVTLSSLLTGLEEHVSPRVRHRFTLSEAAQHLLLFAFNSTCVCKNWSFFCCWHKSTATCACSFQFFREFSLFEITWSQQTYSYPSTPLLTLSKSRIQAIVSESKCRHCHRQEMCGVREHCKHLYQGHTYAPCHPARCTRSTLPASEAYLTSKELKNRQWGMGHTSVTDTLRGDLWRTGNCLHG